MAEFVSPRDVHNGEQQWRRLCVGLDRELGRPGNQIRSVPLLLLGQASQQTFSPSGICTDFRGNILVCNGIRGFGPNYSSVHLLDRDGHFLSVLIPPEACPMDPSALNIDDRHSGIVGGRHSHVLMVSQYLQTAPDILRSLIDSLLVIH